jgi:hypothetical protein
MVRPGEAEGAASTGGLAGSRLAWLARALQPTDCPQFESRSDVKKRCCWAESAGRAVSNVAIEVANAYIGAGT